MGRPLDMAAVQRGFEAAEAVTFIARNFNYPRHRTVKFGKEGQEIEISFKELLQSLGIRPEQLRHFFEPVNDAALPANPDEYDRLGFMALEHRPFGELAKVLGKRVEVLRHVGSTGEEFPYFIVLADGRVIASH